jgi:hypothetical protein
MPKMTDEQTIAVRDMLLQVAAEPDAVWARLVDFAQRREEFSLVAARVLLLGPPAGNAERTARQLAAYRRLAVEIEAEWERIDAVLAGLTPEQLEQARQAALVGMPEFLRARSETADPRNPRHLYLRGMMAEAIESTGSVRGRKSAPGCRPNCGDGKANI